jgi:group I intron endonuclease
MAYGIIYYWYCAKTNMGYVGQTVNTLSGRWKGHVRTALNPNSKTGHWEFPKAIREYGVDNFTGRILCECDSAEELSKMENFWQHELNTLWPHGYNMRDGTNFVCEQTRKLISERTREAMLKVDPSTKVRQRNAMAREDVRQRISERTKTAMQRPEVIANQKAARDEVWRAKISETLKGHVISGETREKIAETLRSRPKKQKPTAACVCCHSSFTVKKKNQRFCSQACYHESHICQV